MGVDLREALGLVGTLTKYLALATLFPTALAIGYGDPVTPFVAAGAVVGALGLGLEQLGRRDGQGLGFREGFFVVSVTWLLAAALAAMLICIDGL